MRHPGQRDGFGLQIAGGSSCYLHAHRLTVLPSPEHRLGKAGPAQCMVDHMWVLGSTTTVDDLSVRSYSGACGSLNGCGNQPYRRYMPEVR
jgi:hypothetical protein